MTASIDTPAVRDSGRRLWEDRLAGPMFALSILFLVILAGLIYRLPQLEPNDPETYLIDGALALCWLVFILEAGLRFALRDLARPVWRALLAAGTCVLVPPLRMTCRSQFRPNHVWLPGLSWHEVDNRLRRTLERFFSIPMICFALLVLPLMAFEYFEADRIRTEPMLALWLDIGTSIIWLAFAVELILMARTAERPWRYCLDHWIDVAIVLLPAVEMLPLFRLLRLGRILRLENVLRWGRLHRLQTLVTRAWRAFLLLQIVQRLFGRSLQRQLKEYRLLLQAKQQEMADIRREIEELEKRIRNTAA
jgi:voltage-gated potassium channel